MAAAGKEDGPTVNARLRIGKRNPAVFPEPVCAQAMRSRPFVTIGIEYFWTGVGFL